jgi:uncharacterized protein YecE (DUF72 family)
MARLWIGTSGWNYKHWLGLFYPKEVRPAGWFGHYARHFSTVEINYSFYRDPSDHAYDAWHMSAPDGFRFAVKAHRYLTHRKRLNDPDEPLERVIKGARRLREHLGPILFQLPPYFRRTTENVARLEAFLEMLPGDLKHAVEFRHPSWWGEETLTALRRHGVAFCWHDMSGAQVPLGTTAPFVYWRFHGGSKKYRGNYPLSSLETAADRIRELAPDVEDVWVYFNNDIGGHAVANARTLRELLQRHAGALPKAG